MDEVRAGDVMKGRRSDAEAQLRGFVALRRRFPTAHELVYDNYNFFVIGYSPTERPSDSIVSIAAGANGRSVSAKQRPRRRDAVAPAPTRSSR